MTLTIKIKCDNAAFEDHPWLEAAHILSQYVKQVREGRVDGISSIPLYDRNGNHVGQAKMTGRKPRKEW